jgi:hypothetical protein
MLALLLLAGAYLELRKRTADNGKHATISSTLEKKPSSIIISPSNRLPDSRPGAVQQDKTGIPEGRDTRAFGNQLPADIVTYPLDLADRVFVSNYGIYAVRQDRDRSSLAVSRNSIVGFDQNGTQEWIPPLPPGSTLLSVYAGGGNRLWVSYDVPEAESQIAIGEFDFGVDSQVRNVWKSCDLRIGNFVIGPQGFIYAAGFRSDLGNTVAKMTEDQSITAELLHIIDPRTGKEQDLIPVTLRSKFDSQFWAGQMVLGMTNLMSQIVVSVKSNGNFFVTIDQTSALAPVHNLMKNEAVEYSSDGNVAKIWNFGSLEPDAYLNRIFVDVDDSILAEIIRHADTGAADPLDRTIIERYLLKLDPGGGITRCELSLYSNEIIQGWIGQTGELVTIVREGRMQQISFRRFPF